MEALLIILGAFIAGAITWLHDGLRWRRDQTAEEARARAAISDQYLPQLLELMVSLRWQAHDIDAHLRPIAHENPYPPPKDGVEVPGHWYPSALRLAHHRLLPDELRSSAQRLSKGMEEWRAAVDDYDLAKPVNASMLTATEEVITLLELEQAPTSRQNS